jgi:hypothetical protein
MENFLSAFFERILQLYTNFDLHRKLWKYLRTICDCRPVDLLNTRKRCQVIECLDLTRSTHWLASCFYKIKKPNKNFLLKLCTRNQSVIAGVHILTRLQLWSELCFIDFKNLTWWLQVCGSVRYKRKIQSREIQSKRVFRSYEIHTLVSGHKKVTQ